MRRPAIALRQGRGYLVTMVNMYHDTMPQSPDAITWPTSPMSLRDIAAGDEELPRLAHRGRLHAVRHARRGVRADRGVRRRRHATSWSSACRSRACSTKRCSSARALRREGHPRVRQGPDALHRPLPRDRAAEVRPLHQAVPRGRRVADGPPRARSAAEPAARCTDASCPATPPPPERLLREAERLFARRGLYQVKVREIIEAAGQRNVSALNYHFGSREGSSTRSSPPRRPDRRRTGRAARRGRGDAPSATSSPRSSCPTPPTFETRRARLPADRGPAVGRFLPWRRPTSGTGPTSRDPRHSRGTPAGSRPRCAGNVSSS